MKGVQHRTVLTHRRIVNGAISVLSSAGIAGLTHRAVAHEAGVSLAATTYHFKTKQHILKAASGALLAESLHALKQLEQRIRTEDERELCGLDDLVRRTVLHALDQGRVKSLAWCEIILNGGRTIAGRALAKQWFTELDLAYAAIAQRVDPTLEQQRTRLVLAEIVGWIFLLHPLHLDRSSLESVLSGRVDLEDVVLQAHGGGDHPMRSPQAQDPSESATPGAYEGIIDAAVEVLVSDGIRAVSYRSVAERLKMVRSAPSYYFPTIDSLLEAAELALFSRAKARYKTAIGVWRAAGIDQIRLIDVTAAILFHEVLEFGKENLGFYSVWLRATRSDALRSVATVTLLDSHRAWRRRLVKMVRGGITRKSPLEMQAIFVGMLIRFIVCGAEVTTLAHLRNDLAMAFHRASGGRWTTPAGSQPSSPQRRPKSARARPARVPLAGDQ